MMSVSWKTPITTNGAIFPRMSSTRVTGVTWSCSSVPRSLSRTIAIAVNWMSVNVRRIAMRPGMMNVAVRRSGLYQGLTRRSTGGPGSFQPALAASVRSESWFEIPPAIAIAWLAVVVSEAFTTRRAFALAPRRRSLPKSWSITRPTEAWPESISCAQRGLGVDVSSRRRSTRSPSSSRRARGCRTTCPRRGRRSSGA
jgi:hypothetical protein